MKTNPKLKLLMAFGSIAVAIVAVVSCTMFAFGFSANSANALFANYSAEHVSAVCSATYQIEGKEKVDFVSNDLSNNIVLNEHVSSAGFAMPQNLQLFADHKSITFEYTFANTGKKDMSVYLNLPQIMKNMNVVETCDNNLIDGHKIVVEAGKNGTYCICASIANLANDAAFSGSFNFVLSNII